MDDRRLLGEFCKEWAGYLQERGHRVSAPKGIACVLQSRNGRRKGWRWLLLFAAGKNKTLNRAEREDVALQLKRAQRLNQEAYVVIRFMKPECKAVVLPAEKALKQKRLPPSKGGIPWGKD